jgi:hypothetical protein
MESEPSIPVLERLKYADTLTVSSPVELNPLLDHQLDSSLPSSVI